MTQLTRTAEQVIHDFAVGLFKLDSAPMAEVVVKDHCIRWVRAMESEGIALADLLALMKADNPQQSEHLEKNLHRTIMIALAADTSQSDRHALALWDYLNANPQAVSDIRAQLTHEHIRLQRNMLAGIIAGQVFDSRHLLLHMLLTDIFGLRSSLAIGVFNALLGHQSEESLKAIHQAGQLDDKLMRYIHQSASQIVQENIQNSKPVTAEFTKALQSVFDDEHATLEYSNQLLTTIMSGVFDPGSGLRTDPKQVDLTFDYLKALGDKMPLPTIPSGFHGYAVPAKSLLFDTVLPELRARLPSALRLLDHLSGILSDIDAFMHCHLISGLRSSSRAGDIAGSGWLGHVGTCMVMQSTLDFPRRLLCAILINRVPEEQLVETFKGDAELAAGIYKVRPARGLLPHMTQRHRREALSHDMEL